MIPAGSTDRDSLEHFRRGTLPGLFLYTESWLEKLGVEFSLDMELLRRRANAPRRENDSEFYELVEKVRELKAKPKRQ